MSEIYRPSGMKIWFHAARPKTLVAASMPVITATALAWSEKHVQWIAAFCCLAFALLAQIAANFANDYFDFKGGIDTEERLGPARAVASGWVKPKVMLRATFAMLFVASLFGLVLIGYGGVEMIAVGLACVVFACLYSTGPYPLSRYGMGDLFVLIFFGFVPVLFTYYVQVNMFTVYAWLLGAMMGLLSVNILVINNYRDMETDKKTNKYTSVVLLGKKFGSMLYLFSGIMACLLMGLFFGLQAKPLLGLFSIPYFVLHFSTWREMVSIGKGRELNKILGLTSRNSLVFCILFVVGLFLIS